MHPEHNMHKFPSCDRCTATATPRSTLSVAIVPQNCRVHRSEFCQRKTVDDMEAKRCINAPTHELSRSQTLLTCSPGQAQHPQAARPCSSRQLGQLISLKPAIYVSLQCTPVTYWSMSPSASSTTAVTWIPLRKAIEVPNILKHFSERATDSAVSGRGARDLSAQAV